MALHRSTAMASVSTQLRRALNHHMALDIETSKRHSIFASTLTELAAVGPARGQALLFVADIFTEPLVWVMPPTLVLISNINRRIDCMGDAGRQMSSQGTFIAQGVVAWAVRPVSHFGPLNPWCHATRIMEDRGRTVVAKRGLPTRIPTCSFVSFVGSLWPAHVGLWVFGDLRGVAVQPRSRALCARCAQAPPQRPHISAAAMRGRTVLCHRAISF